MEADPESPEIVFRARRRGPCGDVALVLEAVGLRPVVHEMGNDCVVLVGPADAARARREIEAWRAENRRRPPEPAPRQPVAGGRRGVAGYVAVMVVVALAVTNFAFGQDWLAAGRIDGAAMRAGEWWRAVTALTLHADLAHIAANLLFGGVFGGFAGRYLGSGVAWLLILLAGIGGNLVNVWIMGPDHRAIGASTAVFAALGLLGSLGWTGRRGSLRGWLYRLAPVIAAVAVLAYTGAGGERTDIGAHIWGFVAGLCAGLLAARVPREILGRAGVQAVAGIAVAALLAVAWALALG